MPKRAGNAKVTIQGIGCALRRVHGKLAMSCTCARVRVAQSIVDLHFCRWAHNQLLYELRIA